MQAPLTTKLTDELRQRPGLLASIEQERLRRPSPETLDGARVAIDRALAQVDGALDGLDLARSPEGQLRTQTALFQAIGATADLIALLAQHDEPLETRPRVPIATVPDQIDVFNDQMRFPVDMGVDGWQGAADPLGTWRFSVSAYMDEVDRGIEASRIRTTIYHASPQSNIVPVVAFAAHLLALLCWIQRVPKP